MLAGGSLGGSSTSRRGSGKSRKSRRKGRNRRAGRTSRIRRGRRRKRSRRKRRGTPTRGRGGRRRREREGAASLFSTPGKIKCLKFARTMRPMHCLFQAIGRTIDSSWPKSFEVVHTSLKQLTSFTSCSKMKAGQGAFFYFDCEPDKNISGKRRSG